MTTRKTEGWKTVTVPAWFHNWLKQNKRLWKRSMWQLIIDEMDWDSDYITELKRVYAPVGTE